MTDNVKNRRKPKEVSDSFDIIEKIYGILPERPLHLDVKPCGRTRDLPQVRQ